MKVIEFQEYEINDLLRTLYYAKDKKMADYKEGKLCLNQSKYEIGIIDDLIARIPTKSYTQKNKIDKDLIKKETKIISNDNIIKIL